MLFRDIFSSPASNFATRARRVETEHDRLDLSQSTRLRSAETNTSQTWRRNHNTCTHLLAAVLPEGRSPSLASPATSLEPWRPCSRACVRVLAPHSSGTHPRRPSSSRGSSWPPASSSRPRLRSRPRPRPMRAALPSVPCLSGWAGGGRALPRSCGATSVGVTRRSQQHRAASPRWRAPRRGCCTER